MGRRDDAATWFEMHASKFEFEQRFWVIGALIFIAFSLGAVDHVNFAVGLLHWIAPAIDPDSARGNFYLRLIFASGALLIFLSALLRTWATAYLRTEVVHDISQHSEALVADGPYRYVRNPLYLANLPMMAGIGVMASRLGWALYGRFHVGVCLSLDLSRRRGPAANSGRVLRRLPEICSPVLALVDAARPVGRRSTPAGDRPSPAK
jgi:protein-S-isoprenylcysteine O-methyltransferase Ste14